MPTAAFQQLPAGLAVVTQSPPALPHETTTPHEVTSEQLAAHCLNGSLEPFERLVERFEKRIYGFLLRHIGNAHDAQDLTQITFVRAWRNIHRFDPKRDFTTWIFVIARRAAANHFRARKPHDPLSEELPAVGHLPSVSAEKADEAKSFWNVARQLKPKHHEALWLRYAEEFSVAETARVMGLTTIHVKVILHRARNELARKINRKEAL